MVELSEDQERELQALHDCIADNKLEAVTSGSPTFLNFTDDEDDEALGGDMDGEGERTRGRTGGRTASVGDGARCAARADGRSRCREVRGSLAQEDALQLVLTAGDAVSGGAMTGEAATEARRAQARRIALAATASSRTSKSPPRRRWRPGRPDGRRRLALALPKHLGSHRRRGGGGDGEPDG